jgi:hypothetical protein
VIAKIAIGEFLKSEIEEAKKEYDETVLSRHRAEEKLHRKTR